MTTIDLVVIVWERTYRSVLQPGFFPDIVKAGMKVGQCNGVKLSQ
jgi:hypothetical protein